MLFGLAPSTFLARRYGRTSARISAEHRPFKVSRILEFSLAVWQVAKLALPALGAPSFRHEEARLEAELRVTDDNEVTQPDTGLRGTKSEKRPRHQKAQVVRHGKRPHEYKKRPGTRNQ